MPLANDVSPVSALVADNGEYVVTSDNWHSVGYGDNVVVIYGSDGEMIRKFRLEDILSRGEIAKILVSTSSRWWGESHYLDEENGLLILKVITNEKRAGDRDLNFKEVKIDLGSGSFVNKTLVPTDKASCEAQGGRWGRFGLMEKEQCNRPTTDAGKECSDHSECESDCVTEDSVPAGTEVTGKCFEWTVTLGMCLNGVKDGKAQGVICED